MKYFLSTAQVADHLGITRDALNAKIRAGEFVAPDAIVGNRFQGWSPGTVEAFRLQHQGTGLLCVPAAAAQLVTTVRQAAEYVRAYGDAANNPGAGIGRTVPVALHILAARLENEIRTIVVWDSTAASRHADTITKADELQQRQAVSIRFAAVDSIIPPAHSAAARSAQLRAAADLITSVIMEMPNAMQSAVTRQIVQALGVERDKILDHCDALDGERTP